MIASPTERWGAWLAAANTDENMLMYTFVRDVVLQDLKKEGFAVPAHRALKEVLTTGLEALTTKSVGNREVIF